MRRFIVILSFIFIPFISLFAQVVVSSGSPNLDVQLKRCVAMGNDVYIDLVLTGNGRWEKVAIIGEDCRAYDDEGNMYKGGFMGGGDYRYGISFEYDKVTNRSGCGLDIPQDIPRKVRVKILDVNEYAAQFIKIILSCEGNWSSANPFQIVIKNLPISR